MRWIILVLSLGASITSIMHGVFMLFGSLSIGAAPVPLSLSAIWLAGLPIVSALIALVGGIVAFFTGSKWAALFLAAATVLCAFAPRDIWIYGGLYCVGALLCFFLRRRREPMDYYFDSDEEYGGDERDGFEDDYDDAGNAYEDRDRDRNRDRDAGGGRNANGDNYDYESAFERRSARNSLKRTMDADAGGFAPQPDAFGAPRRPRRRNYKICPYCGINVPLDRQDCPECGASLHIPLTRAEAPEAQDIEANDNDGQFRRDSGEDRRTVPASVADARSSRMLRTPLEQEPEASGLSASPAHGSANGPEDEMDPEVYSLSAPNTFDMPDTFDTFDKGHSGYAGGTYPEDDRVDGRYESEDEESGDYNDDSYSSGDYGGDYTMENVERLTPAHRVFVNPVREDMEIPRQHINFDPDIQEALSKYTRRGKRRRRSFGRRILGILLLIGAIGGALLFLLGLRKLPEGDLPPSDRPGPRPVAVRSNDMLVQPVSPAAPVAAENNTAVPSGGLPPFTPDPLVRRGIISGSNVNMREEHSTSSRSLARLSANTRVDVLESWTGQSGNLSGPWYRIRTGQREGWVYGRYLQPIGNPLPDGYTNALLRTFGNDRPGLTARLGSPNRNTNTSMEWSGLTATLRNDQVTRLRLSSPRYELRNGLKTGMGQAALYQLMGYPSSVSQRQVQYNEAGKTGITVQLNNGVVQTITVNEIQ